MANACNDLPHCPVCEAASMRADHALGSGRFKAQTKTLVIEERRHLGTESNGNREISRAIPESGSIGGHSLMFSRWMATSEAVSRSNLSGVATPGRKRWVSRVNNIPLTLINLHGAYVANHALIVDKRGFSLGKSSCRAYKCGWRNSVVARIVYRP